MSKKNYLTPTLRVVEMSHKRQMLAAGSDTVTGLKSNLGDDDFEFAGEGDYEAR